MCEIDSRRVLNQLLYATPLKQGNFAILHCDSPDHQDIDVALLYQRNLLGLCKMQWLSIRLRNDTTAYPTCELLYASFLLPYADTLHVLQNHLPSQMTTKENPSIMKAALSLIQGVVDFIQTISSQAHIVVMGDMNMPIDDTRLKLQNWI